MRSRFLLISTLVLATSAADVAQARGKVEMSSLELQQMQSRDVEAAKNTAFAAVMTVLQDAGYRISAADRDTGLITATASTNSKVTWMPFVGFGRAKKTPVVSAYVEEISPNVSHIRLNFVMTAFTSNQYGSDAGEEPVTDASVYQAAFEKIDQVIFIRKAMASAPASSAPVATAVANPLLSPSAAAATPPHP